MASFASTTQSSSFNIPTFVTINDLPGELIHRIFLLSLSSKEHILNTPWKIQSKLPYGMRKHEVPSSVKQELPYQITFSHVCRRWRDVALANPTAWTVIPVRSPVWANIFLERSRPQPISVEIDLDDFELRSDKPSTEVLRELDRISTLTVSALLFSARFAEYFDLLCHPAPSLEHLHIGIRSNTLRVPLRDAFGGQPLTKLVSLYLSQCILSDAEHVCRLGGLKYVYLHSCIVWDTPNQMIDTLSAMTQLKRFTAMNSTLVREASLTPRSISRCVNLPCLEKLALLSTPLDQIVVMFSSLQLSPYAHLELQVPANFHPGISHDVVVSDCITLKDALAEHYKAFDVDSMNWALYTVKLSYPNRIEVLDPSEVPDSYTTSVPPKYPDIPLNGIGLRLDGFRGAAFSEVYSELGYALPYLPNIQTLHIEAYPRPKALMNPLGLLQALPFFSGVFDLALNGYHEIIFEELRATTRLVLFPNLRTLTFINADFLSRESSPRSGFVEIKTMRPKLESLTLVSCEVSSEMLDTLRTLFSVVVLRSEDDF